MVETVVKGKTADEILTVNARRGEEMFIAECEELGVFTQGETWEELEANIREAVELSLEDMGRNYKNARVLVTFEEYL